MVWKYLLVLVCLVATVANIYKRKWCFILWGFSSVVLAWYNYADGDYAEALLFLLYAIFDLWGWFVWKEHV